jgi:hypothetical protein
MRDSYEPDVSMKQLNNIYKILAHVIVLLHLVENETLNTATYETNPDSQYIKMLLTQIKMHLNMPTDTAQKPSLCLHWIKDLLVIVPNVYSRISLPKDNIPKATQRLINDPLFLSTLIQLTEIQRLKIGQIFLSFPTAIRNEHIINLLQKIIPIKYFLSDSQTTILSQAYAGSFNALLFVVNSEQPAALSIPGSPDSTTSNERGSSMDWSCG